MAASEFDLWRLRGIGRGVKRRACKNWRKGTVKSGLSLARELKDARGGLAFQPALGFHLRQQRAAKPARKMAFAHRPIKAVATQRWFAGAKVVCGDAEILGKGQPGGRKAKPVGPVLKIAARGKALIKLHARGPGQMVIADAGMAQGGVFWPRLGAKRCGPRQCP